MDPFTSEGLPAVRFPQRAILALSLLAILLILSGPPSALSDQAEGACESAEDCFRAVVTQTPPANGSLGRMDRVQAVQLAVGRLKELQEQYAGSVWPGAPAC